MIQEKTGVTSIDISSSGSGWEFNIAGPAQAVEEASAAIREMLQDGYDLQGEAYTTSKEKQQT
eukprot:8898935-Heterocapsa_arctica.AAC.1